MTVFEQLYRVCITLLLRMREEFRDDWEMQISMEEVNRKLDLIIEDIGEMTNNTDCCKSSQSKHLDVAKCANLTSHGRTLYVLVQTLISLMASVEAHQFREQHVNALYQFALHSPLDTTDALQELHRYLVSCLGVDILEDPAILQFPSDQSIPMFCGMLACAHFSRSADRLCTLAGAIEGVLEKERKELDILVKHGLSFEMLEAGYLAIRVLEYLHSRPEKLFQNPDIVRNLTKATQNYIAATSNKSNKK